MHKVEIDVGAIQNKISAGSSFDGTIICAEGLLIEGTFTGQAIVINGPLMVLDGGCMSGTIHCDGDVFVLGRIAPKSTGELSEITSSKTIHLGMTSHVAAHITAPEVITYEGAFLEGEPS